MRISDWSSDVCSSDLVHRAARRAVPQDHRLPLVRDAERRNPGGRDAGFGQRGAADGEGGAPDRLRIVLDPAGFRIDLRQLLLRRSEEHTSELQSLMRISYAVFCLTKKNTHSSNI